MYLHFSFISVHPLQGIEKIFFFWNTKTQFTFGRERCDHICIASGENLRTWSWNCPSVPTETKRNNRRRPTVRQNFDSIDRISTLPFRSMETERGGRVDAHSPILRSSDFRAVIESFIAWTGVTSGDPSRSCAPRTWMSTCRGQEREREGMERKRKRMDQRDGWKERKRDDHELEGKEQRNKGTDFELEGMWHSISCEDYPWIPQQLPGIMIESRQK